MKNANRKEGQKDIFSIKHFYSFACCFHREYAYFPKRKSNGFTRTNESGFISAQRICKACACYHKKNWDVSFSNSKGETVDGNSLNRKVVFVNVWATWCPPCIAEMPSINELYKTHQANSDIVFLLVDADDNLQKAENFITQKGFNLPVFIANTNIPSEWFEGSLPTTIVLNKKGNIVYHDTGAANYNSGKFKEFIDRLLNE